MSKCKNCQKYTYNINIQYKPTIINIQYTRTIHRVVKNRKYIKKLSKI